MSILLSYYLNCKLLQLLIYLWINIFWKLFIYFIKLIKKNEYPILFYIADMELEWIPGNGFSFLAARMMAAKNILRYCWSAVSEIADILYLFRNRAVNVRGLDYKMIDIYSKTFVYVDINGNMSIGKILIVPFTV